MMPPFENVALYWPIIRSCARSARHVYLDVVFSFPLSVSNLTLLRKVRFLSSNMAMEETDFESLFNKNVPHILENIFCSLDFQSFKRCREVCHAWNDLISSEKYHMQLKRVRSKEKDLIAACKNGSKTNMALEQLLSQCSEGRIYANCSYEGATPLIWSAINGNVHAVKILLNSGADPNLRDSDGNSALIFAVEQNNIKVVDALITAKADVNCENNLEQTCLQTAARIGHEDMITVLLNAGAQMEVGDTNGLTALIWAVKSGHLRVVKALLKRGADAEREDKDGRSPIHYAEVHRVNSDNIFSKLYEILSSYGTLINKG